MFSHDDATFSVGEEHSQMHMTESIWNTCSNRKPNPLPWGPGTFTVVSDSMPEVKTHHG